MTDKKYCESFGHGERTATHKRDGLIDKEKKVFMCYECSDTAESFPMEEFNVQELEVPGHDD